MGYNLRVYLRDDVTSEEATTAMRAAGISPMIGLDDEMGPQIYSDPNTGKRYMLGIGGNGMSDPRLVSPVKDRKIYVDGEGRFKLRLVERAYTTADIRALVHALGLRALPPSAEDDCLMAMPIDADAGAYTTRIEMLELCGAFPFDPDPSFRTDASSYA